MLNPTLNGCKSPVSRAPVFRWVKSRFSLWSSVQSQLFHSFFIASTSLFPRWNHRWNPVTSPALNGAPALCPGPKVGLRDATAAQSLRAAPEGSEGSALDESGEAEAGKAWRISHIYINNINIILVLIWYRSSNISNPLIYYPSFGYIGEWIRKYIGWSMGHIPPDTKICTTPQRDAEKCETRMFDRFFSKRCSLFFPGFQGIF